MVKACTELTPAEKLTWVEHLAYDDGLDGCYAGAGQRAASMPSTSMPTPEQIAATVSLDSITDPSTEHGSDVAEAEPVQVKRRRSSNAGGDAAKKVPARDS